MVVDLVKCTGAADKDESEVTFVMQSDSMQNVKAALPWKWW